MYFPLSIARTPDGSQEDTATVSVDSALWGKCLSNDGEGKTSKVQTEHEVMAMATSFSCTQGGLRGALGSSSPRADALPEHSPPLASHTVRKSCRLHLAVLGPFQTLCLHPTQSHSYLCLAPRWLLASWQLTLYTVARMTFE